VIVIELLIMTIVAIAVTVVGRQRRKSKVDRDLRTWAQALGLARVGNELLGRVEDTPVGARLAFDTKQGANTDARWTVYARLEPPLDLGLSLHTRGLELQEPLGGVHPVLTGDVDFDRRFVIRADEPRRAATLFTPLLRRELLAQLQPRAMFMLNDSGCAAHGHHQWASEAWLKTGIHTMARVCQLVANARSRVPVAQSLQQQRETWAKFASANALHGISAPLCMWGTIQGAQVYAYAVRTGPMRYQLEVWLRFAVPLGLGLLIQPMRTVDRFKELFGVDDYPLGDDNFDRTFLVRVSDAAGVEELLDQELRTHILSIHGRVGPLSMTDEGVSLRLPAVPPDPAVVPKLVHTLIEIAQKVADRRFGERLGPYR